MAGEFMMLLQVAVAGLLGGVIGLERQQRSRPAGLRTHMIVAAASDVPILLGEQLARHFNDGVLAEPLRTDPIRGLQAIVVGVSFLGAGTIINAGRNNHVRGLTTAASLLLTMAVGVAVAVGLYVLAVGATFLTVAVLYGLRFLERKLPDKPDRKK